MRIIKLIEQLNIGILEFDSSPHHVVEAFRFEIVLFYAVRKDQRKPFESLLSCRT